MELKFLKFTLGVFVIFSIFAFGASAQASSLGSKHWTLVSLNGKAVSNAKAYLEVDPSTERFNGNAGCNRMFGSVKVGEKEIAFSGVATTKMACVDRAAMKLESAFTETLPKATRYKVAGNVLSLYEGNRRIMRFTTSTESAATGVKLEYRKWVLEAIGGKASGALGEQAFVNFVADTAGAGGNTSCNVYGGNYTIKGNTLSIVQVISTMRACIEDDRMTIERSFLDGLQKTNKYEIRTGKLYLYRGDEILLTFRGEKKEK